MSRLAAATGLFDSNQRLQCSPRCVDEIVKLEAFLPAETFSKSFRIRSCLWIAAAGRARRRTVL